MFDGRVQWVKCRAPIIFALDAESIYEPSLMKLIVSDNPICDTSKNIEGESSIDSVICFAKFSDWHNQAPWPSVSVSWHNKSTGGMLRLLPFGGLCEQTVDFDALLRYDDYRMGTDVKRRRFANVLDMQVNVDMYAIIIINNTPSDFYIKRHPRPLLRDERLSSNCVRTSSLISGDYSGLGDVSSSVGRLSGGSIGSYQISDLDERDARQDSGEKRQESSEDSRPSFWDDPYKSVPLFVRDWGFCSVFILSGSSTCGVVTKTTATIIKVASAMALTNRLVRYRLRYLPSELPGIRSPPKPPRFPPTVPRPAPRRLDRRGKKTRQTSRAPACR